MAEKHPVFLPVTPQVAEKLELIFQSSSHFIILTERGMMACGSEQMLAFVLAYNLDQVEDFGQLMANAMTVLKAKDTLADAMGASDAE
jgi:hypothetical protein